MRLIEEIKTRAAQGIPATVDECLLLEQTTDTESLCAVADEVRRARCGHDIDTCSIINARSGVCPEDCKWCSQSRFHHTGVDAYPIVAEAECRELARRNHAVGVRRFSLVTSGRRVTPSQLDAFLDLFRKVKADTDIGLCASMGLMGPDEMRRLREAGVSRYHCNLETSADNFPSLCSTHTRADKLATIRAARDAGLEVCAGGIIGMGETLRQRLMLAEECREAGAVSLPMNLLNPIKGTPLENTPLIGEEEVIRTAALMRLVAPDMVIRFAGGRARLSREATLRMLRGGVNGVMIGDLLTTSGNPRSDDMDMIAAETSRHGR